MSSKLTETIYPVENQQTVLGHILTHAHTHSRIDRCTATEQKMDYPFGSVGLLQLMQLQQHVRPTGDRVTNFGTASRHCHRPWQPQWQLSVTGRATASAIYIRTVDVAVACAAAVVAVAPAAVAVAVAVSMSMPEDVASIKVITLSRLWP